MVIVAGLVAGLVLLLAFNLLGAGFRNPRWLFIGAVLIFALYKYGANQIANDSAEVLIVAQYSDQCADRHVRVTIHNSGDTAIHRFGFEVTGFQPNHSSSVARRSHSSDRIIGVGETWSHCWRVHALDNVSSQMLPKLRWDAEITSIRLAD